MVTAVSQEVERQQDIKTRKLELANLVTGFSPKFDAIVPSHMNGDMFASLALMSLRKPEVAEAALNDMQAFLSALVHSARLGHHPGTENYYLVPFSPKKGDPRIIQGIEGYRGIVDRLYRAGIVTSVHARVVRENDLYRMEEGMDHPMWAPPKKFASVEERGKRIGVYAYAKMADQMNPSIERYSRVIEFTPEDVEARRAMNYGSNSSYSPWVKWTDEMWQKCPTRTLEKWVPSSVEYRRHMYASAIRVQEISQEEGLPEPAEPMAAVDGELVEDWPETRQPREGD